MPRINLCYNVLTFPKVYMEYKPHYCSTGHLETSTVQHCLARVFTRSPRFSHSVPLLKSLHWLPVRYRIIFMICTITYQALSSKQPAYLHSLLTHARQPRQLRSSNYNLLFVTSVKTSVGTRNFPVTASTLWNALPLSVKYVGNTTFRS